MTSSRDIGESSAEETTNNINCAQQEAQHGYPRAVSKPDPIHGSNKKHKAHHIHEFGEINNLVHLQSRPLSDNEVPVPHASKSSKVRWKHRLLLLRDKCFRERNIHQYWHKKTLYRSASKRSIGPDELFLDLVIVGGVAALGHELRETYNGWYELEKFIILFGALITSWRHIVLLWNMWGVSSDLTDKIAIYLVFTCLAIVSLGSSGAFKEHIRIYVGIASFLASAIPNVISMYWGSKEPLLKNDGWISQLHFFATANIITSSPYLAAAFVSNHKLARILYWTALGANMLNFLLLNQLFKIVIRNHREIARLAVNIELFVEKHDVLTMIVVGESILGILFEGAAVIIKPDARINHIFAAAIMSTAMLYALQTLYNNVDAPIAKGGKHAIRHSRLNGSLWTLLHVPYHASLILFATGLGISFHDIAIPPNHKDTGVERLVMKAISKISDSATSEEHGFGIKVRWLFSAGWGFSILFSGIIGALHLAGPRAVTKKWRLLIRCFIVIPIMVGVPFTSLSADSFIYIYGAALVFIALIEYIFVQMDKMGLFKSEHTHLTDSDDQSDNEYISNDQFNIDLQDLDTADAMDGRQLSSFDNISAMQVTGDVDIDEITVVHKNRNEGSKTEANEPHNPESSSGDCAKQRLRERLSQTHKNRLIAISRMDGFEEEGDNGAELV